ncbi:MAG: type II toxin-antitoxin system VapC family toxin [Thermomicrobiales bacterium]
MVTLDSSALIAIIDSNDAFHAAVVAEVDKEQGLLIFPFAIVAEIAYFIERKAGQRALAAFIEDIMAGAYDLDYGENSWRRILELVRRYHDLPLGLADAAVIECAERHGGRVLTLDRRHFGVVEREGLITILP